MAALQLYHVNPASEVPGQETSSTYCGVMLSICSARRAAGRRGTATYPHQRRVSFTLFSSSYRARTAFAISAK